MLVATLGAVGRLRTERTKLEADRAHLVTANAAARAELDQAILTSKEKALENADRETRALADDLARIRAERDTAETARDMYEGFWKRTRTEASAPPRSSRPPKPNVIECAANATARSRSVTPRAPPGSAPRPNATTPRPSAPAPPRSAAASRSIARARRRAREPRRHLTRRRANSGNDLRFPVTGRRSATHTGR